MLIHVIGVLLFAGFFCLAIGLVLWLCTDNDSKCRSSRHIVEWQDPDRPYSWWVWQEFDEHAAAEACAKEFEESRFDWEIVLVGEDVKHENEPNDRDSGPPGPHY